MEVDGILKRNVKKYARIKGVTLKEISIHLGISQVAFDKSFKSKNFPYSKKLNDIAIFLGVTVDDLTGKPYQEGDTTNIANDGSEVYNKSASKNIFFSEEKAELQVLRAENELLKQIIDNYKEEIAFLRSQLNK